MAEAMFKVIGPDGQIECENPKLEAYKFCAWVKQCGRNYCLKCEPGEIYTVSVAGWGDSIFVPEEV